MKFLKGTYLFTKEEIDRLTLALNEGKTFLHNGKTYYPLYIEKKNEDIDSEKFKELIFTKDKKKDIYLELNSSAYKLRKYCLENYKTESLKDIREIIKNQK